MTKRGGPKHHPDANDRTRAAEALRLRLSGMSFEAVAGRLNYRSPSGPRMACNRLLGRIEYEAVSELRRIEGRRLDELQQAVWDKALAGNLNAVMAVLKIRERRARLFGLDSPVRVDLEGISEAEFGERAAELLRITGDAPLRELARQPLPPADVVVDNNDGWSNIGGPGIAAESAEPEPVAVVVVVERSEDEVGEAEAEVVVEAELVEAEHDAVVVALPSGQRRLPASEVIDEFGVPIARSGLARRLGGYDPLAAWRP